MSTLTTILLFTALGSVVSLIGGVILLFKKGWADKLTEPLSAFAAGALLGTAFLDLLPEAIEYAEEVAVDAHSIFLWTLAGIIIFFLLERFVHWFHHHHEHTEEAKKPVGTLIILGDSIHNFIDGVAIAVTFLVDPALGVITTLAVGAHEIPQEIGDFAILLKAGYSRKKVLWLNVLSACSALLGAILTFMVGPSIAGALPILLAVTAGFFIYIALSDLVPEIHAWGTKKLAITESALLILGIAVVGVLVHLLE
jgi:zinc and cadmium transporter